MSTNERLAIAAHLHVMLRRRTGRVIDTEWLAVNPEYAAEITRYARAKAVEENAPELEELATKLAHIRFEAPSRPPLIERVSAPAVGPAVAPAVAPKKTSAPLDPAFAHGEGTPVGGPRFRLPTEGQGEGGRQGYPADGNRYIGRLR